MAERPRRVVWASASNVQLDEIVGHVAIDSVVAAGKVLDVILEAAASLSHFAERGRVVPEIGDRAVREIFVYSYRLIYEITSSEVRVLAVIHGARDFGAWLERHGRPGS